MRRYDLFDEDADLREMEERDHALAFRLYDMERMALAPLRVDDEDNRCGICNRRSRFDVCKSCVRDQADSYKASRA